MIKEQCGTCKAWEQDDGLSRKNEKDEMLIAGYCRRHPPIPIVDSQGGVMHLHPATRDVAWCGDFMRVIVVH